MNWKKWLFCFFAVCLVLTGLFALSNYLIDPFGVFGDPVFNWYAYDMTENPRVAKIAYLDRHHEEYDSYVLGSSKASSLSCEELNEYLDASFYNMTWYGGKLGDELDAANYLLDHYQVKNLVLLVEPQNAREYRTESDDLKERMHWKAAKTSPVLFTLSYLFCNPQYAFDKVTAWFQRGYLTDASSVYLPETGVYNKQRRDIEPIGGLEAYLEKNGANFPPSQEESESMPCVEECLLAIEALEARCEKEGISLLVMTAPQYESDFLLYDREKVGELWRGLAEITEFWDFSGLNSIGADPRYFYDSAHFRNDVGSMALARIFGNDAPYIPEDFGVLVNRENVEERIAALWTEPERENNSVQVPILMYHSLTEDPSEVTDMTITAASFERQLQALSQAGYEAISYNDLLRYVEEGAELPERPVVITFDDGYKNNLTLGAPVLEKYGYNAQIALIGCSVGKTTYKDTGKEMIPHFSLEEASPWIDKGVVHIHSHSYDMHQVVSLDGEGCRAGVAPLSGETEDDFIKALRMDCDMSRILLSSETENELIKAYTYPYGKYSELTEAVLEEQGYQVTVTINSGIAQAVKGLPQSLKALPRITMTDSMTNEELLETIAGKDDRK